MENNIVYWKQRNGELISIDDMDINHLRNTLKMIIRNNNKKQAFVLNGDMANDFNNNYPGDDYYDEDYPCDIINEF
jgi:hypothetical protein